VDAATTYHQRTLVKDVERDLDSLTNAAETGNCKMTKIYHDKVVRLLKTFAKEIDCLTCSEALVAAYEPHGETRRLHDDDLSAVDAPPWKAEIYNDDGYKGREEYSDVERAEPDENARIVV